ncbi:MAG: homoserine O-acetyltransferase [Clostridium sp.]|nr:homoserine O-acetyltransferase [Prevotella sp.]MCM1429385.1 homoserine O-acetyltransferase [Clostridium sp.]MCM1475580.1 homoserine O-acetyltransferase [Muribaculaceae bacterium]
MQKVFHYNLPLGLECGDLLPSVDIAYHTYGTLNDSRDNVVWVMHALTANSDVADWWPHTVEAGKFLDPNKYFIVCANVLGSCYGSTGPASIIPGTDTPWYDKFPRITVRDMVACHKLLAQHLGISRMYAMIGASLGGFQALEWLVSDPDIAEFAVLCATDCRCSPWEAAFNESMYMTMRLDPTLYDHTPSGGMEGLAAARSIALLSYRGPYAYNQTQPDPDNRDNPFEHRAHSYQRYQGLKLCRRFSPWSYIRLCESADAHDVARGRDSMVEVLGRVKAKTIVVSISSDILFPPSIVEHLARMIPGATYRMIHSEFAHDGFLIEHDKLNSLIQDFYKDNNS